MNQLLQTDRFYRNGPDHRGGWLVSFADVKKTFGFKTLEIGRWVTAEEKEQTAPLFFDALSDLQTILRAPAILLTLRETLSLNYGKGGQYGVMAHYEPATQTFALAKRAGPGAIAHEWFHAFDHYIADKFLKSPYKGTFASEAYWNGAEIIDHPLNRQLASCFDRIFYQDSEAKQTAYVERALHEDQQQEQSYYAQPFELAARAFEAFVQDARIKNNFLVKGTRQSAEAKRGLYPVADHRKNINLAFAEYFHQLGASLSRSEKN